MKKLIFIGAALVLSQNAFASYDMYSVNVPDDARPQIDKKPIQMELNEKKQKGYIERVSEKYEYLNNIENRVKFSTKGNIKSTGLVNDVSEIVTTSKFKSVPQNIKSTTIGYAPVGTFVKETGWTGITEIFKSDIGMCQFAHFDLKASNGGYSLSEKDERRDINNKYTFIEITGKEDNGFTYEVDWFEDLNMYTLSCINKEFKTQFTDKVIELAKMIDLN